MPPKCLFLLFWYIFRYTSVKIWFVIDKVNRIDISYYDYQPIIIYKHV